MHANYIYLFTFLMMGITPSLAETKTPQAEVISNIETVTVGNLTLSSDRCIRPSTGANTAAYITITNTASDGDKLIKANCADTTVTELHNHINENGVMKMRPVDHIEIGAKPVQLKPGSLHIMLMGLKDSFRGKKSIPLTLTFEKAGSVTLDFPVKAPN